MLLLLFFNLQLLFLLVSAVAVTEDCLDKHTKISAALITPTNPHKRVKVHLEHLTKDLFIKESTEIKIPFEFWDIPENDCGKAKRITRKEGEKATVPNQVHLDLWTTFYRQHNNDCNKNDVKIIFQYDVLIGHPKAGSIIMKTMLATNLTDITYFGYCFHSVGIPKFLKKKRHRNFHPTATGKAPSCLHAYAITASGAQKLMSHLDPCDAPFDEQIAKLADSGIIKYKIINIAWDSEFTQLETAKYGFHWRDDFFGNGDSNR